MKLYKDDSHKGGVIVKSSRKCNKRSAFKFESVHLPIEKTIYLLYYWSKNLTVTKIMDELECSSHTAVEHASFLRELCKQIVVEESCKIGGPGKTVEIDESMFRKRKYLKGKKKSGQICVFGGIRRETGQCFLVHVHDRSAATLIPIIKKYIDPGTRIMADCWKAYSALEFDIEFEFATVNHSIELVRKDDPSIHTNSIEGTWRHAKRQGPVTETQSEMKESYLSEYMWRNIVVGVDAFSALIFDIAKIYKRQENTTVSKYVSPVPCHRDT